MRASLRLASTFALLTLGSFAACGDDDGTASTVDAGATGDGGGGVDASTALYLPVGTTLTPFLSETAVYDFDQAGDALDDGKDYFAVLDTDAGIIVWDLHELETPITVNSFVWLARHHYFDGQAFHRVINGFVAQGGDPTSISSPAGDWGAGNPGYFFGVEIVEGLTYDGAGVVGMARAQSLNSNGSQFFICLAATPELNGDYTIFARVTEGLDVLPNIVRGEPPATASATRMRRVYIVEKAR